MRQDTLVIVVLFTLVTLQFPPLFAAPPDTVSDPSLINNLPPMPSMSMDDFGGEAHQSAPLSTESPSNPEAESSQIAAPTSSTTAPAATAPGVSLDTENYTPDQIGTQGNWLKKQEWLKAALKVQDQIQETISRIYGTRNQFNTQFNAIDKQLDSFYKEMGFAQGKIHELLKSIERYLDKKRQQDLKALLDEKEFSGMSEREYSLKNDQAASKIKDSLSALEQLGLDMKSIEDLDSSIEERLKRLDKEIDSALQQGERARDIVEEIWYIIDDRKAEARYYELKGTVLETLKAIESYLNDDLLSDFNKVIGTAQNQMKKIQEQTKALEEEGIAVKNRTERVKKIKADKIAEEQKKQAEEDAKILEAYKKKQKKPETPATWYEKIYRFLVHLTTSLIGLFVSEEPAAPPKKNQKAIPPQETPTKKTEPVPAA